MNTRTMENVSHQKKWNTGVVQLHVDPPQITLIKNQHDDFSDKDFVKIKFCRYFTSEKLDLYGFKMALLDSGNQEEFLLFICKFNTTIEVSGTLETAAKVQYLHITFHGEALRQFDMLYTDLESGISLSVEDIFWDWIRTFFLLIFYQIKISQCAA